MKMFSLPKTLKRQQGVSLMAQGPVNDGITSFFSLTSNRPDLLNALSKRKILLTHMFEATITFNLTHKAIIDEQTLYYNQNVFGFKYKSFISHKVFIIVHVVVCAENRTSINLKHNYLRGSFQTSKNQLIESFLFPNRLTSHIIFDSHKCKLCQADEVMKCSSFEKICLHCQPTRFYNKIKIQRTSDVLLELENVFNKKFTMFCTHCKSESHIFPCKCSRKKRSRSTKAKFLSFFNLPMDENLNGESNILTQKKTK